QEEGDRGLQTRGAGETRTQGHVAQDGHVETRGQTRPRGILNSPDNPLDVIAPVYTLASFEDSEVENIVTLEVDRVDPALLTRRGTADRDREPVDGHR